MVSRLVAARPSYSGRRASSLLRGETTGRVLLRLRRVLLCALSLYLTFISYGGSSIIAIALGVGMLLALTRKRFPGSVDT